MTGIRISSYNGAVIDIPLSKKRRTQDMLKVATTLLSLIVVIWYTSTSFTNNNPTTPNNNNNSRRQLSSLKQFIDPKSTNIRLGSSQVSSSEIVEQHTNLLLEIEQTQTQLNNIANAAINNGQISFRIHTAPCDEGTHYCKLFSPSKILIEIVNPNPENYYSVTVTSYNSYTGSATLSNSWSNNDEFGMKNSLVYIWKPIFASSYDIIVREINQNSKDTTPLVSPGVYPIYISEGKRAEGIGMSILNDRISNMPTCQSIITTNDNQVYSHFEGDWLGPNFGLDSSSLRTGWSFLPSSETMGCKFDTYTPTLIQSIPTPKKIYIMGRSVERGVFLSLIDLMLSSSEKEHLANSKIGTCWGRASVTKNNLQVTYQDYRVNMFEDPTKERYIECHNDKIIKDPGTSFIHNASEIWNELFYEKEEVDWPDVVYMVTALGSGGKWEIKWRNELFEHHVYKFVKSLPPTWTGTVLLGDYSFTAHIDERTFNQTYYQEYLHEVNYLLSTLNDPRVRWFDGYGISKEHRMYSQEGEEKVGRSQHFHHSCDMQNDDDPSQSMVVCSNITEMVAQVLLGHALGPKDELIEQVKQAEEDTGTLPTSTMRYCHACPMCMLPFSLVPHPEMTCVDGPMQPIPDGLLGPNGHYLACSQKHTDGGGGEHIDPMKCPASCLESDFVSSFPTESDMVFVRQCPIVAKSEWRDT